ncbi:MAG: hypothetical protein M1819_006961 [Sarea resinae]|nr:MAG: hypothetical protein M1819_006961 [Sarea resinae]
MFALSAKLAVAATLSSSLISARSLQQVPRSSWNGTNSTGLTLNIASEGVNATSPLLYGIMFEDISNSGDGGIYGELISNRDFYGKTSYSQDLYGPTIANWTSSSGTNIGVTSKYPLSQGQLWSLNANISSNATGEVTLSNVGYWGFDVKPQTYNASFYILGTAGNKSWPSHIDVSLRSADGSKTFAKSSIPITNQSISGTQYNYFSTQIVNTEQAPDSNNVFTISVDAAEASGDQYWIALPSLFGETFKGRPNGLRKDIAQSMYDMKPTFLRFPGGNNLEGQTLAEHWKWNETIGPLKDRKGRIGDWGYWNTNGLGLLEYFYWCEDMEIEPILAVWAGYALDVVSVPEADMGPVLQDILNELEYITGNVSTTYGALRASDGHPEPIDLKYVEIGNEDWFSTTYRYRLDYIYPKLKAAYPDIHYIVTEYNENTEVGIITPPPGSSWDTHHYENREVFIDSFNFWDNWQQETNNTDVTIFIGEYANTLDDSNNTLKWGNLQGAISESVYILGAERNQDVVRMTCYAPTFANVNNLDWTPNLISFDADTVVPGVSYYFEQLFASHRGTKTLQVENPAGDFDPLYWAAQIDETLNVVYLKLTNIGDDDEPLIVNFDTSITGFNGTIITGDALASNTLASPYTVLPAPIDASFTPGKQFKWTVPKLSINVLEFSL